MSIYLMTPCSRIILEKLASSQLVKKFPAFYGTRRFNTVLISARHPSISWARSISSMPPKPLPEDPSSYYSLIYSWIFQLVSFPQVLPTKTLYAPILSPIRATCPAHLILLDLITRIKCGEEYRSLRSSLCSFLHSSVTSYLLGPNILSSTLFTNTLSPRSFLNVGMSINYKHKIKVINLCSSSKFLWQKFDHYFAVNWGNSETGFTF